MKPTFRIRLIGLGLTGLIHPLCFPDFDYGALAWIVLVPLHLALLNLPVHRAFHYGWLTGTIAFSGTMTWVITAMNQYGQVPLVISTFLMILLSAYLGLFFGAYAWGYVQINIGQPNLLWLAAPALWVTLEYVRTFAFSGLPWSLLGYSQYQRLTLIQFTDITGVYGMSFLLVLGNVAITRLLVWLISKPRQPVATQTWLPALVFSGCLASALVYGSQQIHDQHALDSSGQTLTVGVIQANIEQGKKWDERYRDETMARYTRLSVQAGKESDLLIWPEAATPFVFEQEPLYQGKVQEIVKAIDSPLLFGSPTIRFQPDGTPYLLNSAFLLNRNGKITGRYDKRHLVPFGEYIPLKSVLFFLDKLVVGIGDFQEGQGPMTLTTTGKNSQTTYRFGVPICFEVIFPDLVRRMANEGAHFLVTITNDAWFGESAAPFQHFGMVVFRAVENHLAVARAANTGISGFIAPDGTILEATSIFSEQALKARIPLRHEPTFYTRHGDIFSWVCGILTGLLMIRILVPKTPRTP